jgi:hypothetical protein
VESLDSSQIPRDGVSLVLDNGSAALGQHTGTGAGRRGLDLGSALESGAGRVPGQAADLPR